MIHNALSQKGQETAEGSQRLSPPMEQQEGWRKEVLVLPRLPSRREKTPQYKVQMLMLQSQLQNLRKYGVVVEIVSPRILKTPRVLAKKIQIASN